ncbi:MAG: aspartate/glutamate racemase family protein [Clostridia bacterium]|nr:aspartate/glutamate racemase family protein [Clostridia bacterium]
MAKLLGILGGLGPMSIAYLYKMITEHTKAECDQDQIDIVLNSRAATPDRTDYILGKSDESPLPYMVEDAKRLERYGADGIIIACNTAHYFIDEVRRAVSVPVPSIIYETVDFLRKSGFKKPGILATSGTVRAGSYQEKCVALGLDFHIPSDAAQAKIMDMIYGCVKCGKPASRDDFLAVAYEMMSAGCDSLILGCTELSVMADELSLSDTTDIPYLADSLEVLSAFSISFCGKENVGFDPKLEKWANGVLELSCAGYTFMPEVR